MTQMTAIAPISCNRCPPMAVCFEPVHARIQYYRDAPDREHVNESQHSKVESPKKETGCLGIRGFETAPEEWPGQKLVRSSA